MSSNDSSMVAAVAAPTVSPALRRVRFKAYLGGASQRLAQLRDSNAALSPQLPADGATISRALARHGHSAQPGLKVPLLALQEVLAFVPPPTAEALDAGRRLQPRGVGAPTTLAKIVQTSALALHLVVENEASVKPVETLLFPTASAPQSRPPDGEMIPNVEHIIERGEPLQDMMGRVSELSAQAEVFRRKAHRQKRLF